MQQESDYIKANSTWWEVDQWGSRVAMKFASKSHVFLVIETKHGIYMLTLYVNKVSWINFDGNKNCNPIWVGEYYADCLLIHFANHATFNVLAILYLPCVISLYWMWDPWRTVTKLKTLWPKSGKYLYQGCRLMLFFFKSIGKVISDLWAKAMCHFLLPGT